MTCYLCTDPDGFACTPIYGPGPHRHDDSMKTIPLPKDEWPSNYQEDPDAPGFGTYWCPVCGEGKPEAAP